MTVAGILLALAASSPAHAPSALKQQWMREPIPGLRYIQEVFTDPPLVIHTVRFRAPESGFDMEAILAKDRVFEKSGAASLETVTSMARRTGAFLVVNADFFGSDGDPLGLMIRGSRLVSEPFATRSAIAWADSTLLFDAPTWAGELVSPSGAVIPISGVNRAARDGEIVLYFPDGGRASSRVPGNALIFEADATAATLGESALVFKLVVPDSRGLEVEPGRVVLFAAGRAAPNVLKDLRQNEEWKLRLSLTGSINWSAIHHALGGGPRLLTKGQVVLNGASERFRPDLVNGRHPRTAVGTTADGEIVVVVVDGRSRFSLGVTLAELATLMKERGCSDAVNLDGGGSSALCLASGVVNLPSDGVERPVANALALFTPIPIDNGVALRIESTSQTVSAASSVQLRALFDGGGAPPADQVIWTSSGAAWVNQAGTLFGVRPGAARVTAWYRGASATYEIAVAGGLSPLR
ncbi:MAG: hypothetical protein C4341_03525 [Armatimonadota bacterium]